MPVLFLDTFVNATGFELIQILNSIYVSLLGGRHPPGASHPTCFALSEAKLPQIFIMSGARAQGTSISLVHLFGVLPHSTSIISDLSVASGGAISTSRTSQ